MMEFERRFIYLIEIASLCVSFMSFDLESATHISFCAKHPHGFLEDTASSRSWSLRSSTCFGRHQSLAGDFSQF
jgi:hypothetical protein